MKLNNFLIGLVLLFSLSVSHAQWTVGGSTTPKPVYTTETLVQQNPTQVTFNRTSNGDGTYSATENVCYAYGCQTLPAWSGYNTAGGYLFTIWSTPRPAGTNTMWGAWSFSSGTTGLASTFRDGLFSTNPNAHVAFLMRGVSTGSYNIGGAGYTVGGLSGFSNSSPCPSGIQGAPETWWALDDTTAGNVTWGSPYCTALQDYHPYNMVFQAAKDGFAYWIFDGNTGNLITNNYIYNGNSPSLPIINEATGFTIGIVFADSPNTTWNFNVWNMAFGWF